MLKEYEKLVVNIHKLVDISLTIAAYAGAYVFKKYLLPFPYGGLIDTPNYQVIGLLIVINWYISFHLFDVYGSYRNRTFDAVFWTMMRAVLTGMLFLGCCMYVFKITDVSRILMGAFLVLDILFLTISKGIAYGTVAWVRRRGYNFRNILLIGSREGAENVIEVIGSRLGSGYRVLGNLDTDPAEIGKRVKDNIQTIDSVASMENVLRSRVVDQIIFCPPLNRIKDINGCLLLAEEMGIPARIFPEWQIRTSGYEPKIASFKFDTFLEFQTLILTSVTHDHRGLLLKEAMDRLLVFLALAAFSPLFLIMPVAIKMISKGPAFFKQKRLGRNGRIFTMYKFRTMVADAEAEKKALKNRNESDGPVFKMKDDPRVIPYIGPLLRKRGLDELPQLINVLKGEMSLVGPRPPIPDEVDHYDVWQRRRLSMKPGITCLWQVTDHRNDISFDDWIKLDLAYIDNWSLWLDFKILLKSLWVLLAATGR